MKTLVIRSTEYEFEHLLAALRRDMREEQQKFVTDPEWKEFHKQNARMNVRLLEMMRPKHSEPADTIVVTLDMFGTDKSVLDDLPPTSKELS